MTEPREYGCVKWPDSGYRDTGEGGMWVYAFVLADAASGFIRCCGPAATVSLPLPDVVLRDDGDVYPAEWPDWRAPDDLSAKDAATEDGRRKRGGSGTATTTVATCSPLSASARRPVRGTTKTSGTGRARPVS